MKLITYQEPNGSTRSGVLAEDQTIRPIAPTGSDDALSYIAGSAQLTEAAVPLNSVRLLAPLLHPPRVFGIGLNYTEHVAEWKFKAQDVPTVFLKLPSSITGPDTDVLLPPNAADPDYEAELAVVIGKPGHHISAADWQEHVFGYTILNDVSARGVQLATTQWTLGKSFPTFTPLGPWIVTADEIADPHALDIELTLSGETMQSANTRDLIFRIPDLIAYLSSIVPLETGDIISTGTPPGVGLGRKPQRWLRPGEEMVIRIEGIGELRNTTRAAV